MRTAIYCRISEDRDGTGLGVARQEQDCRQLAARRGWDVVRVYTDNDLSALTGKPRPAYERMLEDIREQRLDAVIVWRLDRLHRRPIELEEFMPLCERHHIALASVTGDVDISTSSGQLHARIMGAVAKNASDVASERVRRKMVEVAESGRPHGGPRPYGFEADRVRVNPHEAAVIRELVDALLKSSASLRSLVLRLNERGDKTTLGHEWSETVMTRMLLRPRLTGRREHHGQLYPAAWPAIITDEEQLLLRARLQRRAAPDERDGRPRHLLSGLLRCGVCGARMNRWPGWQRNKPAYICPPKPRGNGCVAVTAAAVEAYIEQLALRLIGSSVGRDRGAVSIAVPDTVQERARLEELAEAYAASKLTMAEWQTARAALLRQINEKETAAVDRAAAALRADDRVHVARQLRDRWHELTVDERRQAIATVVEYVVVEPSRRTRVFHPERLHVVWRDETPEDIALSEQFEDAAQAAVALPPLEEAS